MNQPPPNDPQPGPAVDESEQLYCYGHPKKPTRLRCSRCDRPICGQCAVPASVGQHCPECVAEARRSTPRVRTAMQANSPVVTAILAINIGVFVLTFFGADVIFERLAEDKFAIASGEWWRLITPMFLHANLVHIFFNSYVLYIFGPELEQAYGSRRFALIYVVSGFTGAVGSYAFSCSPSVGASGAIFGVVGALVAFLYGKRGSALAIGYMQRILMFVGLNLVLGFVIPQIDNFAHIGGLIGGALLGYALDTSRERKPSPALQVLGVAVVIAVGVAVVMLRTANFDCGLPF
ncbi:MAG: rhomboid family intramembrane serine protease [Actinomycetota bacterium]